MMAHEERLVADATDDVADLSPQGLREVLQNLRVHQIELELQNDELRRTQAALDTAQARYFDFYDLAPVGYVTVSDKALILQANLSTAALLGLPRARLIGKALPGFIVAPDADSFYLLCQQALASGSAECCELRIRHQPDGQAIWVKLQAIAATADNGAAVIRMVLSDVTARRLADEKLRASEESYRALAQDMPLFISAFLPDGTLTYVNEALAASVGLPAQDLIGHNFADHLLPNDRALVAARLAGLTPGHDVETHEQYFLGADDQIHTHQWTNRAFFDNAGNMTRLQAVGMDITARKQAEAQRLANHKFRDAILDSVPSQIAVLDHTGRIVAVNQRWRDFALTNSPTPGQPASNTQVGTNYLAICRAAMGSDEGGSAALAHDGILRVMNGNAPNFQLEYPCHSASQQRWFTLAATPLNMDNQALVITHTDITERRHQEQAAKEASEHKFRLMTDNTSDGIVIFDADLRVDYISPSYVKQFGYTEAEELGVSLALIFERVHAQDRDALVAQVKQVIASRQTDQLFVYHIMHRLGHTIWREDHARFQYDGAGHLSGVCVVARDITQRRQAEEELRIAAVAFESQEAMMITDARSVILRVNQAFTQVTGYTADEAIGQTPQLLQSGQHNQDFYCQLWATVRREGSWQGEVWDRHKDGRVYPKWLTITAVTGIDGAVSHYIGTHFDLSERMRAEAAMLELNRDLTQSRQQLRRLVALNESTLEKEKRHIAREVHDELGQVLTALRMDLSLAIIRHAGHVPALLNELNGMKLQVDRAILGVRNVATRLRPAALDMGLVPAIEWLCHEFTRHSSVVCALQVSGEAPVLDASRAVVVFRIVQESLNNINKYAQASQVSVSLSQQGNELRLAVRDNGIGFDPAVVDRRSTLGLLGMRERVLVLGGQVAVTSTPGHGTEITVVIPLDADLATEPA